MVEPKARRHSLVAWALALSVFLCFGGQSIYAQNEHALIADNVEYDEIVKLNERLRTELNELNSDYDRMRNLQRWTFALVTIGALSLGFVLGYLGRHLKDTAKAS